MSLKMKSSQDPYLIFRLLKAMIRDVLINLESINGYPYAILCKMPSDTGSHHNPFLENQWNEDGLM